MTESEDNSFFFPHAHFTLHVLKLSWRVQMVVVIVQDI